MKKELKFVFAALTLLTGLTACNSNDDGVTEGIEIPGITITKDAECCSAEEALQVYKFLQTLKIVPELSIEVDGKYNVFAYTKTGGLHNGYNELYFVATKKSSGNYVKDFDITAITPLMNMVKMGMEHSTPVGGNAVSFDETRLAVKRTWISAVMNTSENGTWSLSYVARVLNSGARLDRAEIVVNALPDGQAWLKSFKVGDATYYLTLVDPTSWKTGSNEIQAYVSKKSSVITTPYALATEKFTIEIDPRMPDMGNHGSPNNIALTPQDDGSYKGSINITMTGLWRIHLTVRNEQGDVVAGGDDLSDGLSSLFWDVTL